MRKLTKYLLVAVGLFIGATVNAQSVSAATLNYDFSGYWYERQNGDGSDHTSWKLENYYVDGQTTYCIEPGVPEGNPMYQADWNATGLSSSIKDRLTLVAYYGYSYPGHQTVKYHAATQAMIWEAILGDGSWVRFSTARWNEGTPLDISAERAEIENLIAHHRDLPSFSGQVHRLQVGETLVLTDTNNVLSNYDVSVSNASVSVNGNQLTIVPTESGTIDLNLTKKQVYSSEYKLFVGDKIQNMIVPGAVDPVRTKVRINSYKSVVKGHKYDTETGIAQGQATLKGATYGVYEESTGKLVTTVTTDENGYFQSEAVLTYNRYYLQEISSSKGYLLDETKYYFDMRNKDSIEVDVKETVIKNWISILKQYDYIDGNTTIINAEQNITFEILYPDGRKFGEVTTDKNGYATMDIPYGVWKFHQINTNTGFEKIYDFFITVDENSEKEQYYNILNNKMSAYLHIIKVDTETGKNIALADTSFKILNLDTNEYVSQFVGGKVYDTFYTDEKGTLTTYLKLEAGNYKLVEVKSPIGYLRDTDGLDFTIGSDTVYSYTTYGAFVTVYFKNAPIKGQIEVHKTGENVVMENDTYTYEVKALGNVTFEIYASEDILSSDGNYLYYNKGDLVDTITTDKDGYAISKKLPLGKYMIVESKTGDNYILDTDKHEFTLSEKDDRTSIVYESMSKLNYLKKGTLDFTKVDVATGKEIPNTKVEVYHVNEDGEDELIFTGITDEKGKITITDLFVGKFYIIETEAAEGYRLSDEKVLFEIKENGEIVKANMTNEKITSTVKIHKVDEANNPLAGVTIGIYDLEGNLVYSGVTDENGDIEVEVEYGSYYLQEIATLEDYELSDEKVYFDITEDGELIQHTLVNKLKEIEVPNTGANSYVNVIAGVIVLLGTGLIIVSSKKKNKK